MAISELFSDFHLGFSIIVELCPIIPLFYAFKRIKQWNDGITFFVLFLLSELLLNLLGDYYVLNRRNNLFLYHFYAFSRCIFIFLMYDRFFENKKRIFLFTVLFVLLIYIFYDYLYLSKTHNSYNYLSGFIISTVITIISAYYFAINVPKNKSSHLDDFYLVISLVLTLQFLITSLNFILEKFLLDTLNNIMLWVHMKNIYYYFMLLCFIIYANAFRNIKKKY